MVFFPHDDLKGEEEEEEYGKCRKHPSSTRTGVCPICLTSRLLLLCPDCAQLRPCACLHPSIDSSSSSSSSTESFSSASYSYNHFSKSGASVGAVGRVSFLIESEPSFRRSRSAAFYFVRAKPEEKKIAGNQPPPTEIWSRPTTSSFWSFLKTDKTTKKRAEEGKRSSSATKPPMARSRSVGIFSFSSNYSDPKDQVSSGRGDVRLKVWVWRFLSPIKVFRYPKTMTRSPLCRV